MAILRNPTILMSSEGTVHVNELPMASRTTYGKGDVFYIDGAGNGFKTVRTPVKIRSGNVSEIICDTYKKVDFSKFSFDDFSIEGYDLMEGTTLFGTSRMRNISGIITAPEDCVAAARITKDEQIVYAIIYITPGSDGVAVLYISDDYDGMKKGWQTGNSINETIINGVYKCRRSMFVRYWSEDYAKYLNLVYPDGATNVRYKWEEIFGGTAKSVEELPAANIESYGNGDVFYKLSGRSDYYKVKKETDLTISETISVGDSISILYFDTSQDFDFSLLDWSEGVNSGDAKLLYLFAPRPFTGGSFMPGVCVMQMEDNGIFNYALAMPTQNEMYIFWADVPYEDSIGIQQPGWNPSIQGGRFIVPDGEAFVVNNLTQVEAWQNQIKIPKITYKWTKTHEFIEV